MSKRLCFVMCFVLVLGLTTTAGAWEDIDDINYNFSFEYDVNFEQYRCHGSGDLTGTLAWHDNNVPWANVEVDCPNSLYGEPTEDCGCKNDPSTDGIIKLTMGQWGTDSNLIAWQTLDPAIDGNAIIQQDYEYRMFFDTFNWGSPELWAYLYYGYIQDNNSLHADVNVITSGPIAGTAVYRTFGLSFTAEEGEPYIGEPLGVRWMQQGQGWFWIDNVIVQFRPLTKAINPEPASGTLNLPTSGVTLRWTPGRYVADDVSSHEVYFGTDMVVVESATTSDTTGIYRGYASGGPDANDKYYYNVPDTLPLGQRCYWRVDEVNEGYVGPSPPPDGRWKGDVWMFRVTGTAVNPDPADGATDVPVYTDLSWTAGTGAQKHDVYFGTDQAAVTEATTSWSEYLGRQDATVVVNSGLVPPLDVATTYYWRIDEVNLTGGTVIDGDIWSFTTAEYTTVDEFETYVTNGDLWDVWNDYWVNGTGATIFVQKDANFTEDGNSMMYVYENHLSPYYSEAYADITDLGISSDWTIGGVEALRLAFKGDYDNATDDMYVALRDGSGRTGKVLYDGDPNDLRRYWLGFQEWNIELDEFVSANSVDLTDISRITVGFGDKTPSGTGTVYFDSIRLYAPRCVPKFAPSMGSFRYLDHHEVVGSFRPDCSVDNYDLWSMSRDWLMSGIGDVTATSAGTTDLVGHWTMDDSVGSGSPEDKSRVLDSSGNLNHGYLYNGYASGLPKPGSTALNHTTDSVEGMGALIFDGFDDWITIPNAPNLNSNTITVSAWVKPDGWLGKWGTYPPIICSNEPDGFSFGFGSFASYESGLEWMANNELTYFWTGWAWDYHSGLIMPPDLWTFVALVVEPTKGTLYLYDGFDVAASTNYEDHTPKAFDDACFIAGDVNVASEEGVYFDGTLDDVYFYSRALSPEEVLGLAGLSGTHHIGLEPWRPNADGDTTIDFIDFSVMADNWLKEVLWPSD